MRKSVKAKPKAEKVPVIEQPISTTQPVTPKYVPPEKPKPPKPKPVDKLPFFNFIRIPAGAMDTSDALPKVRDPEPFRKVELAMKRGYRYDSIISHGGNFLVVLVRE